MAAVQTLGKSNEWYTPKYVFDAMEVRFDLDVAHPPPLFTTDVPANKFFHERALERKWHGFVWMNPPFGGRNGMVPWMKKFMEHGDGVALSTDTTSAKWWQDAAVHVDAVLLTSGRVRFVKPDGSKGGQPVNGTTLWACGGRGVDALKRAEENGLGVVFYKLKREKLNGREDAALSKGQTT